MFPGRKRILLVSAASLLVLATVCDSVAGPARESGDRSSRTGPRDGRKKWAYLIPASFRAGRIEERLRSYDVLCLGVYRFDANGKLYQRPGLTGAHRTLLARVRKGRRLYPLLALRGPGPGARMLASPASRARAAREISTLLGRTDYDGIHLDFEFLPGGSAEHFAAFLKEIKSLPAMHGRVLSMAAFPPLHGKPAERAFWNMRAFGPHLDQVVYMTYDYHLYSPGPVTHLDWARRNLDLALKTIAPDKVWLGVPGYGYEWKSRPGRTPAKSRPAVISEPRGKALCARHGCIRHDSGMLQLIRPGKIAFLPDPHLRREMAELARQYNLRGTALWRIGFETGPETNSPTKKPATLPPE